MGSRRDRPHAPFRCLDAQYRRELVRVYLTNVEALARKFVDEKRDALARLRGDAGGFRAFWGAVDARTRRQLATASGDAVLKARGGGAPGASGVDWGFRVVWFTMVRVGGREARRAARRRGRLLRVLGRRGRAHAPAAGHRQRRRRAEGACERARHIWEGAVGAGRRLLWTVFRCAGAEHEQPLHACCVATGARQLRRV